MIKIGNIEFADPKYILDIRDRNQVIQAKVVFPDDAIHKVELMKENYVQFSFLLDQPFNFKRGYYINYEGTKYILRTKAIPEVRNKYSYKYTLKFEAEQVLLQDTMMYYLRQNLKESTWSLTSDAASFIKIAVDNANRYFGGGWSIGSVEPSGMKYINFDKTNVFDALTTIAENFDAEWFITGRTINLVNKLSYGAEVEFAEDVSIISMSRSEGVYNN